MSRFLWFSVYVCRAHKIFVCVSLRLAKVIIKNKMSRFFGSLCTIIHTHEINIIVYGHAHSSVVAVDGSALPCHGNVHCCRSSRGQSTVIEIRALL